MVPVFNLDQPSAAALTLLLRNSNSYGLTSRILDSDRLTSRSFTAPEVV